MSAPSRPDDYKSLPFHPYSIYLFLLLMGLSMLFVGCAFAYVYTLYQSDITPRFPHPLFLFNSVILLVSSYFIHRANAAYMADDTKRYQRFLLFTVILTIVFLLAQIIGWQLLLRQEFLDKAQIGRDYLYLLSILHFGHVVGGIPFLGLFLYVAYRRMKEPVSVLIYFSDPAKRLKLRLLTIYWHFLDGLWLFLMALFLLNWLVFNVFRGFVEVG